MYIYIYVYAPYRHFNKTVPSPNTECEISQSMLKGINVGDTYIYTTFLADTLVQ